MNFSRNPGHRIDDYDLPRIGKEIGVGEDEIHAVLEVEASGSGYDDQGRIKMLFEPHIFYQELLKPAAKPGAFAKAVNAGLAYKNWGAQIYPRDSYPRLLRAIELDEAAALKSCSWGLGQILGRNYAAAGFPTVQAMVESFCKDEANQLQAMIDFIQANHLDDELRRHDWAGFARGYNGSQYAKHNYHGRLKAAYEKWSKIKDTQWPPLPEPRPAEAPKPAPPVPAPMPSQKPVQNTSWLPWFRFW